MKHLTQRRPSASLIVATVALVVAASGTAIAASKLVKGDKLIAKHSLSGNRLRNHTITGGQVNLQKLGTVPNATNAVNAANAAIAAKAATTAGYFNSGQVTLTASATSPGTQQTLDTIGPFSFIAQCLDNGGGSISANIIVKDNSASGAIVEDDNDVNYSPPSTLNSGDTHAAFEQVTQSGPYWFGDYYNMFAVAAPGGPGINGQGSEGVHVLGADCAFDLILFS